MNQTYDSPRRELIDPHNRQRIVAMNYLHFLRKLFLTKHFRRAYGQFGEDIPLFMLFRKRQHGSFFVDVGAFHPTKWSNTFYLYKKGWRGVLVEMQPAKALGLRLRRPGDTVVEAAVSDKPGKYTVYASSDYAPSASIELPDTRNFGSETTRETVVARTLTEILDNTKYADRPIDLLNIDCEGHDFAILRSLDFERYRPKVIAVEHHEIDIAEIMQGEMHRFIVAHKYMLVNRAGLTCIYADPDFIGTESLV